MTVAQVSENADVVGQGTGGHSFSQGLRLGRCHRVEGAASPAAHVQAAQLRCLHAVEARTRPPSPGNAHSATR
ncbi:hypothetical protein [Streptomyces sp. NPDC047028]|uniref:hypothetical protein n=1 Tax=Streptomyces sp. NPDC047028 TaxID=3155793 RepID=UPI0033FACC60